MGIRPTGSFVLALLSTGVSAPTVAHADVLMNAAARTLCLDVASGSARLSACTGSPSQNFLSTYGEQRYNGLCLQGTGGNNATNALSLKPCNGSKDQRWAISNNGNFRNEGGWCAAATGSNSVIAAQCYGGGTYAWSTGRFVSILAAPPSAALLKSAPAGAVDNNAGVKIASGNTTGRNSLIGQDGNGIIAQGVGNVVKQNGGYVVITTAGSIVSQGTGN